jgi:hypothetical protein
MFVVRREVRVNCEFGGVVLFMQGPGGMLKMDLTGAILKDAK